MQLMSENHSLVDISIKILSNNVTRETKGPDCTLLIMCNCFNIYLMLVAQSTDSM